MRAVVRGKTSPRTLMWWKSQKIVFFFLIISLLVSWARATTFAMHAHGFYRLRRYFFSCTVNQVIKKYPLNQKNRLVFTRWARAIARTLETSKDIRKKHNFFDIFTSMSGGEVFTRARSYGDFKVILLIKVTLFQKQDSSKLKLKQKTFSQAKIRWSSSN